MMSRPDGFDYDYPPELLQGVGGRLWEAGDWASASNNIGPNRHNVTSTSISSPATPASFTDTSSSATTTISSSPPSSSFATTRTLFWGDLEPWMDEEYVKQVCSLMGWEPQSIKVPSPNGPNANNPGYCILTFPSQSHASSVIAQLNAASTQTMPNSSKPFHIQWASQVQIPHTSSSSFSPNSVQAQSNTQQQYPTEYSIFVGDLAPETSNSDLVAVFRNPVLGLRNDREPKFIRPFLSCKSAKIMLDPVTGVSRGYGFVRFTDESDQQRALIEMHGLYCLSRPMRISPATAKFKPPPAAVPQQSFPTHFPANSYSTANQPVTFASAPTVNVSANSNVPTNPNNGSVQPKSVSSPIAATTPMGAAPAPSASSGTLNPTVPHSPRSGTSSSTSNGSLASTATAFSSGSSEVDVKLMGHQLNGQQFPGSTGSTADGKPAPQSVFPSATGGQSVPSYGPAATELPSDPSFLLSQESWKHHAQARAILGHLIGPNGEQLTSTDPYNTTVFVGGLSPLINEDTLRTFFAPFGDIHYVKVPVGKNCGFVQFVRKADAEKAIDKMQGFPIGGSRIRLSWGRSQYKAAQAAAQAAQAAALQVQGGTYGAHSDAPATGPGASNVPASLAHIHSLLQQQASNRPSPPPAQHQQSPGASNSLLSGVNINTLSQEQAIQLLQKLSAGGLMDIPVAADERQHGVQMDMGFQSFGHINEHQSFSNSAQQNDMMHLGIHHPHQIHTPPGAGLYAEEKLRAAHLSSREDAIGSATHMRHHLAHQPNAHQLSGLFDHSSLYGFNHTVNTGDRRPSIIGTSFSPFSPNPNATSTPPNGEGGPASLQRRESVVSAGSDGNHHGPNLNLHDSNSNAPVSLLNTLGSKVSPTTARPTSSLSRYGSSQGIGSIPSPVSAAGNGRTSMGNGSIISRPTSGQHFQQQQQHPQETFDTMHDLNGTLASLDLDSTPQLNVGSPTNVSFNAPRSLSQFGAWNVHTGMSQRNMKSPDSEGSGPEAKYLSPTRNDDPRAISPM